MGTTDSMINNQLECYLCGRTGTLHKHHCLHGSRRKKADKYGLIVYLCPECHMKLHDHGIGDRYLQQIAQAHFESKYGHERYMDEFGKNYL